MKKAFISITKYKIKEILDGYNYPISKSKYDAVCDETKKYIEQKLIHFVLDSAEKVKLEGNKRLIQ